MSKNLVVLGALESGTGAAILGKQKGYHVFISDNGSIGENYRQMLDNEQIAYEQHQHTIERVLTADLIVKSPGIPEKAAVIQAARQKGIQIVSEIEFASWFTSSKIIAITGSNGKTTTTALLHHLLYTAGINVALAGNIGNSFSLHVAQNPTPPDYYVLEVSSFQLDDIEQFCPHIAILTNITPDHLDRYNYEFKNYIKSKYLIGKNQKETDFFVFYENLSQTNTEFDLKAQLMPFSAEPSQAYEQGAYYNGKDTLLLKTAIHTAQIPLEKLCLKGKHNLNNALAAAQAALLCGLNEAQIAQGLSTFEALPHRLEPCGTINGIAFINDSKATNIDSTWFALDAMTQPIVWIAGGTDKGNDYGILTGLVQKKVKALICLTTDNTKLHHAYDHILPQIANAYSANEAVQLALQMAQAGDVVLLSPACASFDLFKNYIDRGMQFKKAVADAMPI